jgi:Ca2+-binding RTX toxin-like protein
VRRGTLALCFTLLAAVLFPATALADRIVAVASGNQLVLFGPTTPSITAQHQISGLLSPATEVVYGIDTRPKTGQVFIFTSDGTGRSYTVNPDTGAATPIGEFPGPVSGPLHGYDFNPTADRIRLVTSTDQNLRINPDTGALANADTNLTFTPPATGPIIGAAYDHNTVGAGPTTLYEIDAASYLDIQGSIGGSPMSANSGAVTSIGPLGVTIDPSTDAGFDIAPNGVAYAALKSGGVNGLYTIDLASGHATSVGRILTGAPGITSLTLASGDPPTSAAAQKCQGKTATIVGTNGADKLTGTKGPDVIAALGGKDKVNGLKGKDRLCGGTGKDRLLGGPGKDRINGEAGRDTLIGGPGGGDVCKGGGGKDVAKNSCEKDPGVP